MNLTEEELLELIAQKEGRTLEFKQGLPRDEKTARTLCAFANTRGGYLLVGVMDNREVCGAPRPRETMATLRRIAAELLEPPIEIQATLVSVRGKPVIAVRVNASRQKPHSVLREEREPEVVVRVGASNRGATGATLDALRNTPRTGKPSDALERRILEWIASRNTKARLPGGDATVARFAKAQNVGLQRAQRAFVRLERDGYLVAHGRGGARAYSLA